MQEVGEINENTIERQPTITSGGDGDVVFVASRNSSTKRQLIFGGLLPEKRRCWLWKLSISGLILDFWGVDFMDEFGLRLNHNALGMFLGCQPPPGLRCA